ncbi:lytic transglycosylase domain-containing protein [Sphingomonas arenae]|uniref:lytic transglycosylase domain-containing protein n=1 Tax=Sphingomonas arenae TaxID=2812555 RepID=UPI001966E4EE|nr:lytic transglycosylase domain-containing protein [Sphingomonas arenae]
MSFVVGVATGLLILAQEADPLAPIAEPTEQQLAEPSPTTPVTPVGAPPAGTVTPAPAPAIVPKDWAGVFLAIRSGQWAAAQAGIAILPQSPLSSVAKAELYTAKGSPKVALDPLLDLLLEAPDLPKADQIQRMAEARGAEETPRLVRRYPLVQIGASPRRGRARPVTGEPEADKLRAELEASVKADDAAGAELLLNERYPLLSPEARAEASQRVAWIYYVRGLDADARRVADNGRMGATGEWAVHSAWVSALASWRQNDCESASRLFRQVGQGSAEPSLSAAGYYWAARSEMVCRRPAAVTPLMRAAARSPETFYGLVARRTLGMDTRLPPLAAGARTVDNLPNVRRAIELNAIGERDLAGQFLRYQARIGEPADQLGLVLTAQRLGLAATQHFLAHFGRAGALVPPAARYPNPGWSPPGGWRIDPALGMAHALQESSFRTEAVSQAGAVGLMQVLPTTASLIARNRGGGVGNLLDPPTNMEFGQSWIEWMRGHSATQGQLPKVIASYNAGPLPVGRWQVNDKGDPLLWIESIPYWETRFYVPQVLRNMWVYQGFANAPTPTLTAMAQHRWPTFPAKR